MNYYVAKMRISSDNMFSTSIWSAMEDLLSSNTIVIDRPKCSAHPRYPNLIYPFDYRYIKDTTAADGEGIDIWVGSLPSRNLTGILCSYDSLKRDA